MATINPILVITIPLLNFFVFTLNIQNDDIAIKANNNPKTVVITNTELWVDAL